MGERKSMNIGNVIRIIAYVFLLFFVVPTVILLLVLSIIPIAILVTAATATLMIHGNYVYSLTRKHIYILIIFTGLYVL